MKRTIYSAGLALLATSCLAGTAMAQPSLIGEWKGEQNTLDTSGNGHHGTIDPLPEAVTYEPGIDGFAFSFGNVPGRVLVEDSLNFHQFDYAVTGWFKTSYADALGLG